MEDYSTSSISNTISKDSVDEEMSLFRASMEDAASRLADGIKPEVISNEKIQKGDEILETYQVTSDAIHGGMGSVWRVHHNSWDVDLAMKRPQPKSFAEGSERRKAEFVAECENWINLGLHPNIVSCYYVRDISGVPSIFSEWMDSGSLKDCIRDGSIYEGARPEVEERMLDIAIQFANGLHYAHEAGLLHQDVKPGNLLLNKEWEAKVADFGLAQAHARLMQVKAESDVLSWKDETIISSGYTPAYCSPEQENGERISRSTDIYSWAVSVLELFLGERPWKRGAEVAQKFDSYLGKSRIPLPQALINILRHCLKQNPKERPQSFMSVKAELKKIYKDRMGLEFARPELDKAISTADSLNNRALSYLDLGRPGEAEKCWQEALKQNGGHAESVYNRALMQWRSCKISDIDVLTSLETCMRDLNCARLLAKIELERGNPEGVSDGAEQSDTLMAVGLPALDELTEKTGHYVYQDFLVAPDGSMMFGQQQIDEKNMEEEYEQWNLDLFLPPGCMKNHITYLNSAGDRSHTVINWATETLCNLSRSDKGDYELRIDELQTGRYINSISVAEAFHPVFFSKDGTYLFTREKAVLDIRNGKVINELQDIPLLLSPDGRIFAARYDRSEQSHTPIVIYNTDTMEPLKIMKGSGFLEGLLYSGTREYRTEIAFSPDGTHLYTGDEKFIRALNTETGEETIITNNLDGFPFRFAVSSDGTLIAATQQRGIVILEINSGRHLRTIPIDKPSAVAFFGDRICTSIIKNGATQECCFTSVNTPAFGYRADWALSRIKTTKQQMETERIFASGLAKAQNTYEKGEYQKALSMLDSIRQLEGMANDPRALSLNRAIGVNGTRISLESIDIARELSFGKLKCSRIAFSDDGSRILCHCDSKAFVIETESGNILSSFSNREPSHRVIECNDFAIDHSGKNVMFGGNHLYNAENGEIRNTLKGMGESFYAACFTPDDRLVAVACKDETLRIYRTSDGELEGEIVIGPIPVYDLALMPDGDILLANAHEDREIEMISISRKKIVNLMETPDFYGKTYMESGNKFPVIKTVPSNVQILFRRINVSPDGKTILLEGDDFRCLTMDYDTHRLKDSAADSPVIRRAVYTGWGSQVLRVEGELQVLHAGSINHGWWRVRDTKLSVAPSLKDKAELVLRNDRNGLNDVAVSPNGRYVGIVLDDGVLLFYETNWKYEIKPAKKKMMGRLFHVFSGSKEKP